MDKKYYKVKPPSPEEIKKRIEEMKKEINVIQSLIIPEENFDLIYERNKLIKSFEKHGRYKYNLNDLKSFEEYLLKELEKRSKLSDPEKLKSYIKHKCDCDIESYAYEVVELSTDDIEKDVYKLIQNEYDYNEKDRYLYLVEKYALKIKEKYSKLFE